MRVKPKRCARTYPRPVVEQALTPNEQNSRNKSSTIMIGAPPTYAALRPTVQGYLAPRGWAFSYERGAPVHVQEATNPHAENPATHPHAVNLYDTHEKSHHSYPCAQVLFAP